MEVHVSPETAKKLNELATISGRAAEEIIVDEEVFRRLRKKSADR